MAAGYVGSFQYQIKINAREESGEAGYCEYVDCRPLKWQEKNKNEKILNKLEEHSKTSTANNAEILEKINKIEKWRWMIMGGAMIVGYVLAHIKIEKLF